MGRPASSDAGLLDAGFANVLDAQRKGGASMMDSMEGCVVKSQDPARTACRAGDLLRGHRRRAYETQARKRLFAPIEEKTDGDRR